MSMEDERVKRTVSVLDKIGMLCSVVLLVLNLVVLLIAVLIKQYLIAGVMLGIAVFNFVIIIKKQR